MKKISEYIKHPSYILLGLDGMKIITLSDKDFLKIVYLEKFNKKLNFDAPKTLNEKINWLKLYDRNPAYTTMVDKYEAKKYAAKIIGDKYIIPTIGIYNNFDEINFDKLPDKFVMKCTHDSGGIIICKDKSKLNIEEAKKKINKSLKKDYYRSWREWPYKNVKHRIVIEQYMEDEKTHELRDYKFFCFNGKVKYFKIDFNRETNHQANYFDKNGVLQYFGEEICPPDYNKKLNLPINLEKMKELSEKLSNNTTFLRVDFYEVNGKIYFGELTFYPAAGFGRFIPDEWNKKLGDLIILPNTK